MKKIFSLTNVFIKEFYQNLSIFDKKNKKVNKKSMFFWLIAIIFFGVIYVSFEIIKFLVERGQPEIFLTLFFVILALFLLFQIILICGNLFFFSKDIEKVLPMPLKPVELLLAKFNTLLVMLYLAEVVFAFVPLTLYGLMTYSCFTYYFWEIIVLIVFPILLASLVSTIMLVIMRFTKFIKNKDIFQLVITVVLIAFLCFFESIAFKGLLNDQNEEPSMEQITNFTIKGEQVGNYFLIINPSIVMLSHPNSIEAILSFMKLIVYNLIAGVVFILIGNITYLKDILRSGISSSHKKRKIIEVERNTRYTSKGISYISKELKMLIRVPAFFMQCVFPVIIILITGVVLVSILAPIVIQVMQEEEIQEQIRDLTFNTEMVCDILIVLQVLFSISHISLTGISREGRNAIFIKYIPISLYKQFVYKNIPQIMLNFFISIGILGMIWYTVTSINILYLFLIFVISLFINFINSYLMLLVDLRRPNLDWDTEYAVVKKSDNKIFQYAFMIVNVLFLMYLSSVLDNMNLFMALISEMIIFAIVFIILDRCIKKWQDKIFNKII